MSSFCLPHQKVTLKKRNLLDPNESTHMQQTPTVSNYANDPAGQNDLIKPNDPDSSNGQKSPQKIRRLNGLLLQLK